MDEKKLWDGFCRQRRNLMLISIALLLIHAADLKFTTINIFGNKATFQNQTIIHTALWIAWAYWLLRYHQYSRDIGDKGYEKTFKIRLNKKAEKAAQKKVKKSNEWHRIKEASLEKKGGPPIAKDYITTNTKTFFKYQGHVKISTLKPSGHAYDEYRINITLNYRDISIPLILAVCHVLLNTTLVTEYILPYFIAFMPFFYILIW